MAIVKYTSPPNILLVKGVDITAADVYVTIQQNHNEITVSGADLSLSMAGDDTQVIFYLTQEQTASFNLYNKAKVQVNWIASGHRYATVIKDVKIYENLIDEVIS